MELYTERLFLRTITEADVAVVRAFGKDEFATDENGETCEFDYFQLHREDWLTFA